MTADTRLRSMAPFFVVSNLKKSIAFYRDILGFSVQVAVPEPEPFFALLRRDDAELSLKEIGPEVSPQPNHTKHEWAKWDASVFVIFFSHRWENSRVWALPTPTTTVPMKDLEWHLELPVWTTAPGEPRFDLAPSAVLKSPGEHPKHWHNIVRNRTSLLRKGKPIQRRRFGSLDRQSVVRTLPFTFLLHTAR